MQVPTSATGYEEEAQAAATGHEEAQPQALVWCLHRETEAEAPVGRQIRHTGRLLRL